MIEVLVGTMLLAIATFAVFDGLDGAQKTGRMNKQRSVSATLAQQDIERLRSFPVTSLSNYRETRTVNMAGVAYTVVSRSDWVVDAGGVVSCTSNATNPQYMKLSSSVHSPESEARPVREVSLLTPAPGAFSANAGTAAVKVTDRDGQPIAGARVVLTGPGNYADVTNDLGCAILGMIAAGSYEASVDNLVGWGGDGFPGGEVAVVAATTSLSQIEVDGAASLDARFELPPGVPADWAQPAVASAITVANAKLPGGFRDFAAAGPTTSIEARGLFPFLDGYGVYAGTCRANNPAFWQPDYFLTSNKGFAALNPGDLLKPVPVQVGALRVVVEGATSPNAPVPDSIVTVRRRDLADTRAGCGSDTLAASITSATGIVDFVLPFGSYRICASGRVGTSNRYRQTGASGAPADIRLAPGPAPRALVHQIALRLPSSGSSGSCSTT